MIKNPWPEGDYLCYGEAVRIADNEFFSYYSIAKKLSNNMIETIVEKKRFGDKTYETESLAVIDAIQYGQYWVRKQQQ